MRVGWTFPSLLPCSLHSPASAPSLLFSLPSSLSHFLSHLVPEMASRRRDSARTGYSSADAYRSVPSSNSHATHNGGSSSEEDHLTSPYTPGYPTAVAGVSNSERPRSEVTDDEERPLSSDSTAEGSPLSPPKPFFTRVAAGDRRSWSSVSLEHETSDSDAQSGIAGVGAGSKPSRSATQPVPAPASASASAPASRVRTRNHHRRRSSMANEYAVETAEVVTSPVSVVANPFSTPGGTPTSSVYGAPAIPRGAPPSSFPFQSHPGNPDPGTPIPGVGRRASLESLNQRSPPVTATGTAYSPSGNAAGYGLVRNEEAVEEDLGRPYAPFMNGSNPPREGSVSPGPNASQNHIYRNSAAGAMAGEKVCPYNLFITSFSIPSLALSNSASDTVRQTSLCAIFLVMNSRKSDMIFTCSCTIHCFLPNS